MKKVNFKKRVSQLMAGVFGLALMGGVMLSAQNTVAQQIQKLDAFVVDTGEEDDDCTHGTPTWRTEWSDRHNSTVCYHGGDCCCAQFN